MFFAFVFEPDEPEATVRCRPVGIRDLRESCEEGGGDDGEEGGGDDGGEVEQEEEGED